MLRSIRGAAGAVTTKLSKVRRWALRFGKAHVGEATSANGWLSVVRDTFCPPAGAYGGLTTLPVLALSHESNQRSSEVGSRRAVLGLQSPSSMDGQRLWHKAPDENMVRRRAAGHGLGPHSPGILYLQLSWGTQ